MGVRKSSYKFMEDNKYAEKWTLDTSIKFLDESLKTLQDSPDMNFIGTLAVKMGIYREIYPYLLNKFGHNHHVFNTLKQINSIIESRLVEKGIKGDTNPTMTIFTLKNNHSWTDKVETVNTNTNTNTTIIIDGQPIKDAITNENDLNDLVQ